MALTKISDTVAGFCWEQFFQRRNGEAGPLEFNVSGGATSDNVNFFEVPDTTVTLEDDAVNLVALFYTVGIIDTTTNRPLDFNYTLLYEVTTAGGVITDVVDKRTHFKQRNVVTSTLNGFVLDDYTKLTHDTNCDIWYDVPADVLTSTIMTNIGGTHGDATLLYPEHCSLIAGPGAPALSRAIKFNYTSSTDMTSAPEGSAILMPYRFENDNQKSNSLDDQLAGVAACWIYIDADTLVDNTYVFTAGDAGQANQSADYRIRTMADGRVIINWRRTSAFTLTSNTGIIQPRTWHHVAYYKPQTGVNGLVYIDGQDETASVAGTANDFGVFWNQGRVDYPTYPGVSYGRDSTTDNIKAEQGGISAPSVDVAITGIQWWWNIGPNPTQMQNLYNFGRGL